MAIRATIIALLLIAVVLCSSVQVGAQTAFVKKYVIFRDDDVLPGSRIETLKAVNDVHIEKNVPVTLGIVPHPNDGEVETQVTYNEAAYAFSPDEAASSNQLLTDQHLTDYLRSIAANPLFEFAQHGYTHRDDGVLDVKSEFYGRPYYDQNESIRKGRDDIREALGITPTTFIPPFNKGDVNTLTAVEVLGFTDYCTDVGDYRLLHRYADGIRVESSFTIGAVNYTSFAESMRAAKDRTERFLNDPQGGDTLVVAYHHWMFSAPDGSVDQRKVKLLGDYIDYLINRGDVFFARLDRLPWRQIEPAASTSTNESASVSTKTPVTFNAQWSLPFLSQVSATPAASTSTNESASVSTKTPVTFNAQSSLPVFGLVSATTLICAGLFWFAARQGVKKS
jgi:hypothetical protein